MAPNIFNDSISTSKCVVDRSRINLKNVNGLSDFVPRPGHGQAGKKIFLMSNHFPVEFNPDLAIYHYDVAIECLPQPLKIVAAGDNSKLYRKLSYQVNRRIINTIVRENSSFGKMFHNVKPVYDGNKNLFTVRPLTELMTAESGKPKRITVEVLDANDVETQFVVSIKFTGNVISLNTLTLYFENKSKTFPFAAIQALDIVLRQGPSMTKISNGHSFFEKEEFDQYRHSLGGGKQLSFGFFQSLRLFSGGAQLVVDRSSNVFYQKSSLEDLINKIFAIKDGYSVMNSPKWTDSERKRIQKEIKGLQIEVTHLQYKRKYRIQGLSRESANEITFEWYKQSLGGRKTFRGRVTVAKYFAEQYQKLKYPQLPCVTVSVGQRQIHFPIEVCVLVANQNVDRKKLSTYQVAQLIRICSFTEPKERFELVQEATKDITQNKEGMAYLNEFGISVGTSPIRFYGRVLNAPVLLEKNGKQCIPRNGKWRINQFFAGAQLKRWIVVNIASIEDNVVANTLDILLKQAAQTGMEVFEPICKVKLVWQKGTLKEKLFDKALEKYKTIELILFVGLESDEMYNEIKRCGDIELGIPTQCIKKANVYKMNQSIVSNLLLKINSKLGGQNVLVENISSSVNLKKTIVIGADVAHPPPTEKSSASVAALVGSMDSNFIKHYATVRVQQRYRDEIIKDVFEMLKEILLEYEKVNGFLPNEIIIYRDGVSEGQFSQVVYFEIHTMKHGFLMFRPGYNPKITFIVVQKRHHTKFVPDDNRVGVGKNKNVPPGTTVDTTVVNQKDFDFYLCSHEAIQGTSRPAHYYVLYDDNNYSADELESITYSLCHTYARCTRSVSIPATVYYAHLAAFRGRGHMGYPGDSESGSSGSPARNSRKSVSNFDSLKEKVSVNSNMKGKMYFC